MSPLPDRMRIAVMGSGAVGGYFGARLAAAGADVTFVARGEHLRAMQHHGLRITSAQGPLEVRSTFVAAPDQAAPVDLVLFSVKSQDTESAARALGPLMGSHTLVLSLQNGVDNADKIARLWGHDRSLAGVAYVVARVAAPGLIEHEGGGQIVLGSLHAASEVNARAAQAILTHAKISSDVRADIRAVLWRKLAWNAPFCALSCLLRMTVGEILASASLESLVRGCAEEVLDAARCHGLELPASTVDEVLSSSGPLGHVRTSMLNDLEAGKPLEHEALNGIVVRTLQQSGRRGPINEILYAALRRIDQDVRAKQAGVATPT